MLSSSQTVRRRINIAHHISSTAIVRKLVQRTAPSAYSHSTPYPRQRVLKTTGVSRYRMINVRKRRVPRQEDLDDVGKRHMPTCSDCREDNALPLNCHKVAGGGTSRCRFPKVAHPVQLK